LATAGAMRRIRRGSKGEGDEEVGPEDRRFAGIGAGGDIGRFFAGKRGDGPNRRHLHLLVDGAGAAIQRAPEDVGEADDVVDLVGEVRAAGADHGVGPCCARHFRHDLRRRVGQRQDQRLFGHALQEFRLQHAGGGKAEEDVGARDDVGQRARLRVLDVGVLPAVHLLDAAFMRNAETVGHPDVFDAGAERDEQVEAGKCRSTGA